jgi:hypothetical protein
MDTKLKSKVKSLFQGATANGQQILSAAGVKAGYVSDLFNPDMTSLAGFFNAAFKTAIVIGAILAVLRLGYAGFVYITSDLPGAKGNAKDIIGHAVTGLLLLLAIWLILNQINPQILNLEILQGARSSNSGIPVVNPPNNQGQFGGVTP